MSPLSPVCGAQRSGTGVVRRPQSEGVRAGCGSWAAVRPGGGGIPGRAVERGFQPGFDQPAPGDAGDARPHPRARERPDPGPAGDGKTHLAVALGVKAVECGFWWPSTGSTTCSTCSGETRTSLDRGASGRGGGCPRARTGARAARSRPWRRTRSPATRRSPRSRTPFGSPIWSRSIGASEGSSRRRGAPREGAPAA